MLIPPPPASLFSFGTGLDVDIGALITPGGRPRLKEGPGPLVGGVVELGGGSPKLNTGFGAIDTEGSWFFSGGLVVPGAGRPTENGCLVAPVVVLCVAPNPNLKSLVPEEAPNPLNEEMGFAPGRAPNENPLPPSFIPFVVTPNLLTLGCWLSSFLTPSSSFSPPLSFLSSSMSMEVLWLDLAVVAAALDPESEVKDTVFPPKENPVVSS